MDENDSMKRIYLAHCSAPEQTARPETPTEADMAEEAVFDFLDSMDISIDAFLELEDRINHFGNLKDESGFFDGFRLACSMIGCGNPAAARI